MRGVLHIAHDIARREPHKIQEAEALVDIDVLEGDGFALVAVENSTRSFVMHMDDLGFRRIMDLIAGVHHARSPVQVL